MSKNNAYIILDEISDQDINGKQIDQPSRPISLSLLPTKDFISVYHNHNRKSKRDFRLILEKLNHTITIYEIYDDKNNECEYLGY